MRLTARHTLLLAFGLGACGGGGARRPATVDPAPVVATTAAAAPCTAGCALEVANLTNEELDVMLESAAIGIVRPHDTQLFPVTARPAPQLVGIRPLHVPLPLRCRRTGRVHPDTLRVTCDTR